MRLVEVSVLLLGAVCSTISLPAPEPQGARIRSEQLSTDASSIPSIAGLLETVNDHIKEEENLKVLGLMDDMKSAATDYSLDTDDILLEDGELLHPAEHGIFTPSLIFAKKQALRRKMKEQQAARKKNSPSISRIDRPMFIYYYPYFPFYEYYRPNSYFGTFTK